MARHSAPAFIAICYLLSSIFCQATPVLFPLNQMFSGASYTKSFTLQAAQSWITDGTNAWIGAATTVTPSGGTNPVVQLTPNTYLVKFSDATYTWRIAVPNTTTVQNAITLSAGPLPTFLVQPATPLPVGLVTTNNAKFQWCFNYYTFGAGAGATGSRFTNGVWLYTAKNFTNNYVLTSWTPIYQDPNNFTVRDTYIVKYADNTGRSKYLLTYSTHYGDPLGSATPGPGVAESDDGMHFSLVGYVNLTTNYFAQWSPKFSINATNGLIAIVGLSSGVLGAEPTNAVVYDVNSTNLLLWTNPRPILAAKKYAGDESAGVIIFTNGLYFYFSSLGEEYTNASLSASGWGPVNIIPDALGSWGYAGPAVFFWDGLWYWFTTDSGFHYITSPDLVTWTPSVFAGGDSYAVPFPAGQQEGAVIPDLYAVTAPGSLSLTNIPAVTGSTNIICTDSNGAEMTVPISNIVQGATFSGTISVSGVNTTLFFTNGLLKAHSP